MLPAPRRPFLASRRPLSIATARRRWDESRHDGPAGWSVAEPIPLEKFREKLAEIQRRAVRSGGNG